MSMVVKNNDTNMNITIEILDLSVNSILLADELKGRGYRVSVPTPKSMQCGSSNERYLRNR